MKTVTLKDILSLPISCKLIVLLGLFYIGICVFFAGFPGLLLSKFDGSSTPSLYGSALLDLIFGAIFVWAASSSRFPVGFSLLGTILPLNGMLCSSITATDPTETFDTVVRLQKTHLLRSFLIEAPGQ